MNEARILASLRREVRARAKQRCEYCLIAESQSLFPHEPDHLIALKHGGRSTAANLALACSDCNRFKGSDIASIDRVTGKLVRLFNPRMQKWSAHFRLIGGPNYSTHTHWSSDRTALKTQPTQSRGNSRAVCGSRTLPMMLKFGSRKRNFLR